MLTIKKSNIIALVLTLLLLGSMPVMAHIEVEYNKETGVQVFGGTFRDQIVKGQNITLFALIWRPYEGPVPNVQVKFTVMKYGETVFTDIVTTNKYGIANTTFTPEEVGWYNVEISYNSTTFWTSFEVIEIQPYYFVEKNILAKVGENITLRWALIEPFTRKPYTNPVNIAIIKREGNPLINTTITPVNGILEYTVQFNTTGEYYVYLDGQEAGAVKVTNIPLEVAVVASENVREGKEFTVHVFAKDVTTGMPYSGDLILKAIYFRKEDITESTYNVTLTNGYGHITLSVPLDAEGIAIELYDGKDSYIPLGSEWIGVSKEQVPEENLNSEEEAIMAEETLDKYLDAVITPQEVIATPGEFLSFEVTSSTALPGYNYTLEIIWYPWTGKDSLTLELASVNRTYVQFDETGKLTLTGIKVPEDAYFGVIKIGNAEAYVYVYRPYISSAWDYAYYVYNPENHEIVLDESISITGLLENATYESKFTKPLPNEPLYIYTPTGVHEVKTDEEGSINTTISFPRNPYAPIGFGEDINKVWALLIHDSGTYGISSLEVAKIKTYLELNTTRPPALLSAFKYYENETPTSIPIVLEFAPLIGNSWNGFVLEPQVYYWNTTELKIPIVEPGKYLVTLLPTGWVCRTYEEYSMTECSSSNGWEHEAQFLILPEDLEIPKYYEIESTKEKEYIEIPIKLPGKGYFYYKTWDYTYVGVTDEQGNGILKLKKPNQLTPWGDIYYWGKFGFVTEEFSLLDIEWSITIHVLSDEIPPTVDIRVNPTSQQVGKNVTITYEASDNKALKEISIVIANRTDTILNMTIDTSTCGTDCKGSFNFTVPAVEEYTVKIIATDEAGLTAQKFVNFYGKVVKIEALDFTNNKTTKISVEKQTEIYISANETEPVYALVIASGGLENEDMKSELIKEGAEDFRYIKVETNKQVNYEWVILNVTYDEEELKAAGVPEIAVTIFYWNGSEWIDLSKYVGKSIPDNSPYGNLTVYDFGVDTKNNYVWANVSHLSDYTFGLELPDLKVVSLSPSEIELVEGEQNSIVVTIKNDGASTNKNIAITLYANDTLIGTKTIPGLGKEESTTIEFPWIPEHEGKYTLKAIVDPENTVVESNEDNNEISISVLVSQSFNTKTSQEQTKDKSEIANLALFYYYGYLRYNETYSKLYNESVNSNVSEDVLRLAKSYYENATKAYANAERSGPIYQNLGDIRVFIYIRRAYLNIKNAVNILKSAVLD
ncbi:CARDB domain-containing protein [Thermococcus alcaliphilus]|uniref:CARDB domain-containing protein n=1 Tax=Thermococcus alcaliphilus TaxID=139207 RepID=UPI0020907DF9|nr:CARDB domain-containing protein [Thermococcus alcaliphilus]MCO6040328.1 hypothetical protein [Thermococcus alcaliphilus]